MSQTRHCVTDLEMSPYVYIFLCVLLISHCVCGKIKKLLAVDYLNTLDAIVKAESRADFFVAM
jgi:hypothetical protein